LDSALVHEPEPDLHIRVVTSVYFCATKLEAFAGRGKNDYQTSHDLDDLMAVVDGRAELIEEIRAGIRKFAHTLRRKSENYSAFASFSMHYLATCSPMKRIRRASRSCLSA
jgi:hypothetical protein